MGELPVLQPMRLGSSLMDGLGLIQPVHQIAEANISQDQWSGEV